MTPSLVPRRRGASSNKRVARGPYPRRGRGPRPSLAVGHADGLPGLSALVKRRRDMEQLRRCYWRIVFSLGRQGAPGPTGP